MKRLFPMVLLGLFFSMTSLMINAQVTQIARNTVQFPPLTNNGTTGPLHTRGVSKARVTIACQYNSPPGIGLLPNISWQLTGVTTNSRNVAIGDGMINQTAANMGTTATIVIDVPTEAIKADFVLANHGTAVSCEVGIYGDMPYYPRSGKVASELTGVIVDGGNTYTTPGVVDLGEYDDVRIAYDAQGAVKAPLVTVIGIFDGDEVPIENIPSSGSTPAGGSIFLKTPPIQIKLKFKNQDPTGRSLKVRWYVYGTKRPPLQ